jgi:ubiquinone/menaquinone biosynthesis C-methylase UbiE
MKSDKELKQYSWFTVKIYSFLLLFSKNTFAIDTFIDRIDRSRTILELGSGTGRDFRKLKSLYNITGSDYSDPFLKLLRKRFKKNTFLKVNALQMDVEKRFDVIYSNKVLQHLTPKQLSQSLSAQYDVLNKDGVLFHAMWKGDSRNGKIGGIADFCYDKKDFEDWEEKFTIEDFVVFKEMKENDSFIIILKKRS